MFIRGLAAISAGLIVFSMLAVPADAQTRRKRVVSNRDRTVVVMRDEDGRTRTRIIIQRRSYLDAGVNLTPGQRKFTDYVIPPTYSPTVAIDNTVFNLQGLNRPGPFEIPSRGNPQYWR
jgi:hypothetical protein